MLSKSNQMIFIIILLLGLFITNCSDDDKEDTLEGTWVLTSVKSVMMGITITLDPAEMGLSWILTVRDDNSYTLIITEAGETTTSNGDWATSGDKLFITEEGETMEFDYSLEGDRLELSREETEDGTTITVTYVFTRQ